MCRATLHFFVGKVLSIYSNKCQQFCPKNPHQHLFVNYVTIQHAIKKIIINIYQRLNTKINKNQQMSTNVNNFVLKSPNFECICGKMYKERTGLWRHKKEEKIGFGK
jgi:hypothetical protein